MDFTQHDTPRFWNKVDKRGPDECWEWTAGRHTAGYGQFWVNEVGRSQGAHRISYGIAHGPPGDLFVCHTCDNPPCVNPAHLFLGSGRDNSLDCRSKGRNHNQYEGRDACSAGHTYVEGSYFLDKQTGARRCRICARRRNAEWEARKRSR